MIIIVTQITASGRQADNIYVNFDLNFIVNKEIFIYFTQIYTNK